MLPTNHHMIELLVGFYYISMLLYNCSNYRLFSNYCNTAAAHTSRQLSLHALNTITFKASSERRSGRNKMSQNSEVHAQVNFLISQKWISLFIAGPALGS